jgi:hypothetical protein
LRILLSCFFIFWLILPGTAFPAAWTLDKGRSQLISTTSYISYSGYGYDSEGYLISNTATKREASIALEYGLSDSLTLGMIPHYQYLATGGQDGAYAAGSSEFFLRKRLWYSGNMVLSVQPMLKIATSSPDALYMGENASSEAELRLLAGQSIYYRGKYHFINMEAGMRKRFIDNAYELHLDSTVGIRPYKDLLLLTQNFTTIAVGARYYSSSSSATELSLVAPLNDIFSLQMGVTRQWTIGNTVVGNGITIALWMQF